MPPPVPVPSKAAIHALRGIAFGTSCAIAVIAEDRRRRINILKTAVSNGEKIKAAKRYHGVSTVTIPHEDTDSLEEDDRPWHKRGGRPRKYKDFTSLEESSQMNSTQPPTPSVEAEMPTELHNTSEKPHSQTPVQTREPKTRPIVPSINVHKPSQIDLTSAKKLPSKNEFVTAIDELLESSNEDWLDRALAKFFDGSRLYYSFRKFDDEWIAISAQLSKACQKKSRWDDAGKVLATTINAGPLDESQFYNHEPWDIIEFYLEQRDTEGRCPPEAIAAATHIFIAELRDKPHMHTSQVERIGRQLFTYNMSINRTILLHRIYWRIITCAEDPTKFMGWVIREFYKYNDYRSVIKYFLLNYSKRSPTVACYNQTVHCVISSVEALKGHKAKQVLEALARMDRPGDGSLRTSWIMKTLGACWDGDEKLATVEELFGEILSLDLISKVSHPQGVYRTMVEFSVKAKEYDIAISYYELILQKYPDMFHDIALRGFLALAAADAGNWDDVFDAFTKMQALKTEQEEEYDNAFIMVLKVFAQTHPAAEVRDFVSKYTTDLGVRMHRYAVTLVANKFGECRDMSGFISWLAYCCQAGFALDPGICNSILYNCWATFKLSYPELLEVYSKIRQLGPSLTDDVTKRIMNQAATAAGRGSRRMHPSRGVHSRTTITNELAYRGKVTNQRDVYEAMNKEIHSGRPATAMRIYKQALSSGMPSCEHCLRLAVVATSKAPKHGSDCAIALIRTAYDKGADITSAVAAFIRLRLEQLQANAQDLLLHMRNLVNQFEAVNVIVQPSVYTKMALMVIEVGHFERGISLCTLAMNQHGFKNLAFSRQSIRAMLTAYARLRDVDGMKKLCCDILESELAADKFTVAYLKSARRVVNRFKDEADGKAMLDTLENTIGKAMKLRTETRAEGATIAQETLRIMQEAVADMQKTSNLEMS